MGNGKNIQKNKGTALSKNLAQPGSSLENVDMNQDITVPRIGLLQPGSDAVTNLGCQMGNYFNKATKEEIEELDMVPLYMFKQRILFEDEEIACRSDNSISPSQGLMVGQHDQCAQCPNSQWTEDKKNGNTKPPLCRLTNNSLIYLPEDLKKIKAGNFVFPKVISFAKTAFAASKEIISTALFLGKDLFCFGFTMTSVKRQKDKYTYFAPAIKEYQELPADMVNKLAAILPKVKGLVGKIEIEVKDVSDGTEAE